LQWLIAFWLQLAGMPLVVWAEAAAFRSFDGPKVTWELLDVNAGVEVLAHGCVGDEAREGTGSERISLTAPIGDAVHFACPVGRVPVLDEVEAGLWVKANQPGVTIGVRVVLPRSIDEKTGAPHALLLVGAQCGQTNRWQHLQLVGLPRLLAEQVRVARAAPQAKIDPREAYVDAIVLVVPGAVGGATVWTDALTLDGIVMQAVAEMPVMPTPGSPQGWRGDSPNGATTVAPRPQPAIERRGSKITVAGRPFFARGIRWRDEPLEFLAARGFNCVWTDELPTEADMALAARANLWFVCPPPRPDAVAADGLAMPLDRVLAWNLGTPQSRHDLEYFRRWADLVHERDPLAGRPIIVAPTADWWPASKIGDVLLARHAASCTMSAADFSSWLRSLPLLTQPETPFWAAVPTQPGDAVRRQMAALSRRPQSSASIDELQLAQLVGTAAMAGYRGILFESDAPLDTSDEPTAHRALAVEAMNRQLQLIEPWLTNGKSVGQAVAVDSPATAMVLQVERARLVVPASWHTWTDDSKSPTAIVVPGTPESNEAYAFSPGGLRPLASKRIAGGVRVELEGDADSLILLTDDPTVIATFRQRLARDGRRALQLERDLAIARAKSLVGTARRLEQFGASSKDVMQTVGAANTALSQCNSLAASGKLAAAFERAEAARRMLADAAERQGRLAPPQPLVSLPCGTQYGTLAEQLELQRTLAPLRGGENLLEGGDFENLADLKRLGWKHVSDPLAGVVDKVELSPREAHVGRYSLELSARAEPPEHAPQIVARPIVWIASPAVRVSGDKLLEITGWVRVTEPIRGSIDALSIVDSLGGPELAMRINATSGWQPFHIVRGTSETSDVTVTFSLAGLGTATIDGVAIRTLESATTKRLPPITTAPQSPFGPSQPTPPPVPQLPPTSAQLPGPLFPAPTAR
jgi:hypothetical protein